MVILFIILLHVFFRISQSLDGSVFHESSPLPRSAMEGKLKGNSKSLKTIVEGNESYPLAPTPTVKDLGRLVARRDQLICWYF